jgi:dTDP-glucose pyrophosphorylase
MQQPCCAACSKTGSGSGKPFGERRSMSNPHLVVMAAGIGSRFGGLKQIEPVGPGGEVLLDYALYDARNAGFRDVTFVIRRQIEQAFVGRMEQAVASAFNVSYAYQEIDSLPEGFAAPAGRTKPWGTAHAVLCARDFVDLPFAVINADDFYGAQSFKNIYDYLCTAGDTDSAYDYCMVGYRLANTLTEHGHVARGVCTVDSNGCLETIVERTQIEKAGDAVRYRDERNNWVDIKPQSIVSMNMFGFTVSFMDILNEQFPRFLHENIDSAKAEFFIPTVVNELISAKRATVKVLPTPDAWIGVTYKEDTPKARNAINGLIAAGAYPRRLWG